MNFAELLTAIDQFDLEAYLLDKGFEPLRDGGDEWIGDCPHCGKRKLAVDVKKRGWHCWIDQQFEDFWSERDNMMKRRPAQGAGGLLALVKWLDELEMKEAIEFISNNSIFGAGIHELPDLKAVEQVLDVQNVPAIPFPEGSSEIVDVLPYMARRGITMTDVRWLGLFQCLSGKYRNRIVFPVWEDRKLIYWQARALYDESDCPPGYRFIKALNPERTAGCAVSSEVLMNLDVACKYPRVAIVEGPMDGLRAGPDAVCTFGKQISPAQVRRLLLRGVKAIDLMWDGPKGKEPEGARPEMIAVAPWLSMFFDLRLVFLPHGDPGDWSREWLGHFRTQAPQASNMSKLAIL